MPETRDRWALAVQAVTTPQSRIELPEGGQIQIWFDAKS
jgi:hypothetical protein